MICWRFFYCAGGIRETKQVFATNIDVQRPRSCGAHAFRSIEMFIKNKDRLFGDEIPRSEITPRAFFENRRRVLKAAGALAATGLVGVNGEALAAMTSPDAKGQKLAATTNTKFVAMDKVTPLKDITSYNNFY